jgi:hypothetical protein
MADIWKPHAGMQENACRRWEFECFLGGAAGPGKTDVIVMEALRYIKFSKYRAVIFRRTYPELEEIIDRTKTWYPAYEGTYKEGVSRWFFPSGATVKLSHMQHEDDKYKHRGKEYQYIGFDEATAFSPTQYLYLFSRARSIDPRIPVRIRAGSNPGGPSHQFFKDRFRIGTGGVEPGTTLYDEKTGLSRVFIPGLLDDNPTLLQNDPGYLARLDMLPEIERMRLRFGVWDAFEGQVFSELNKDVHGCEDFEVPPEWERFRTFDWGYSAPFSCGWWSVDYDGKLYRYREWYGGKDDGSGTVRGLRMSDVEIARGIRKIEEEHGEWGRIRPGPADPSIWSKKRTKDGIIGPSTAEEMSREGIHWIKADNDRIGGKRQVHLRLRLDEDGKPGIFVFNSCRDWWRTFPLLREDPKVLEDVDTDQEDHGYDETRYACMYRPIRPRPIPKSDVGSFQYERRKLIKARAHAIRYGVSLTEAYGRV